MAEVEELIVRAKPEGIDETTDDLEGMEKQFEETSEEMEEQSSMFQGLANKISGVMKAMVAGIAIAVGGIMSQVPVLGEVLGGVKSVVDAVAYQLDKKLRPSLTNATDGFYELSGAIYDGDWDRAGNLVSNGIDSMGQALGGFDWSGATNQILDSVGGMYTALGNWAENTDVKKQFNKMIDGIGRYLNNVDWGEFLGTVTDGIATFFANIDWLGIIADANKKFGNALGNLITDTDWAGLVGSMWDEIGSAINDVDWMKVGGDIITGIVDGIAAGTNWGIGAFQGFGEWIYFDSGLAAAINSAFSWGEDLIEKLIDGINGSIQALKDALKDPLGTVNAIIDGLEDIAGTTYEALVEITVDLLDMPGVGAETAEEGSGEGDSIFDGIADGLPNVPSGVDWFPSTPLSSRGDMNQRFGQGTTTTRQSGANADVYLDGRLINDNQKRYNQTNITGNGSRI